MVLLQQLRSLFVSISLTMVILTVMVFGSEASLAANTSVPIISQAPHQIATTSQNNTIKNIEGKVQEALDKMSGNQQPESVEKEKQFKAKTLEGMNNSFVNPNYKPSGESDSTENLAREATEGVENQIRDTFN